MRHLRKRKQIGSDASHRRALLRNLATEILKHEKITTTRTRAREVRPVVERIITLAKRGDLHARRQISELVTDREVVNKLFAEITPRYQERPGGYTRILKLNPRQGDAAPMVLIELV